MTVQILKSRNDIDIARKELVRRGISCVSSDITRYLRRIGFIHGVNVGDYVKSWDIFKTSMFIQKNVSRSSRILDIGSYTSEILCVLHRMNYTALTGIDLNPEIKKMPHADAIRYEVADFMNTPFENASFDAITAISVIEHGFNGQRLLKEVSRLLRPGGYFIASFDYWPEKISTSGMDIFGMDWKIFSKDEVTNFISEAQSYKLNPFFDEIDLDADEKAINWGGKEYTFAWLVLQKNL